MISLNIASGLSHRMRRPDPVDVSLSEVEARLSSALADLSTLVEMQRERTLILTSDVLFHAAATLFPPERMCVLAARRHFGRLELGTSYDVTSTGPETHSAYVRADAAKLREALLGFERAGVELGAWLHSHPGSGAVATCPSGIDRRQYRNWARDFGEGLLGVIVVADGTFRLWGDAVESGRVKVDVVGRGVRPVRGQEHVYRLDF